MNQLRRNTGRGRREARLGANVARLLSGSWREANPQAESARELSLRTTALSEAELNEITPLLCASGAGALAWWRLRDTPLAASPAAAVLHEVYRRFRLSALIHEREVAYVFGLLADAGIEAVLVKGWSIARRYPDRALRPYGDIDLCVRPDQYEEAAAALKCLESIEGHHTDLHRGFARIGQTKPGEVRRLRRLHRFEVNERGEWDDLFARSHVVMLGERNTKSEPGAVATGSVQPLAPRSVSKNPVATAPGSDFIDPLRVPVRVLCDEDHLRILCLHLLRSGAHRAPWLCDVALLIESSQSSKYKAQSSVFDWNLCLGPNPVHANWVGVAVGLAHELLGADISETPFAGKQLPHWLAPAVLQQWGGRRVGSQQSTVNSMSAATRLWTVDSRLLTDLYRRWDNPIRATAAVGGRFDERSRLPYRLAELIARTPEAPVHLRSLLGRKRGTETREQRSEVRDQKIKSPRWSY